MAGIMLKQTIFRIVLCILFSDSTHSTDNVKCIETSVCRCNLHHNEYIDISELGKNNSNLTVTDFDLTYYYYPCQDIKFDYKKIGLDVNATLPEDCSNGTTLCLYNATSKSLTNLGHSQDGKFSDDYPKSLIFTYFNNVTSILLECAPDMPVAKLVFERQGGNPHNLILFSPHSCKMQSHPGLSIGSTLLILCGTIFGVYLIGGALILHFLRGARGKEMVPNLEFWSSIPGLMKDGMIFLLSGCNPMVVSNAETYDRI